jgi:hypothetical protein
MIDEILAENNKILANVFFQTLTNQAHLNSCTAALHTFFFIDALYTYIIKFNIIRIINNLIAQCNRTSRYTLTRPRL